MSDAEDSYAGKGKLVYQLPSRFCIEDLDSTEFKAALEKINLVEKIDLGNGYSGIFGKSAERQTYRE